MTLEESLGVASHHAMGLCPPLSILSALYECCPPIRVWQLYFDSESAGKTLPAGSPERPCILRLCCFFLSSEFFLKQCWICDLRSVALFGLGLELEV